ncbi:MAG TPA: hypothetical protein VM011_02070 [Gammaproteobacteria bacterium]|nr:hypothetical protein [Gammaproteobacteria bacterium]
MHKAGDARLYRASADPMERNLFQRVEVAFPILDGQAITRILDELAIYLADNTPAWTLQPDGSYHRLQPGNDNPTSAQTTLLEKLADT